MVDKYFGGNNFWREKLLVDKYFGGKNFWWINILEGKTFGEKYYLDIYFGGHFVCDSR